MSGSGGSTSGGRSGLNPLASSGRGSSSLMGATYIKPIMEAPGFGTGGSYGSGASSDRYDSYKQHMSNSKTF
jgi:hypothetical protein